MIRDDALISEHRTDRDHDHHMNHVPVEGTVADTEDHLVSGAMVRSILGTEQK